MPNLALVLFFSGILLLYCEFIWVGKLVCGSIGAILSLTAIWLLSHIPHASLALVLLGAGCVLFALQAMLQTYYAAPIAATASLAVGFRDFGVSPSLDFPACILMGVVTTVLLSIIKKGRENKRADI